MNADQLLIMQGVNALKEKKLIEAEKIFKSSIQINPFNVEANHFLGITFQLLNKMEEAIAKYKETIKIKPDFAEAHFSLGNIFYILGKINKAEPYCKTAIQLEPNLTKATSLLNIILEQKKVLSKIKDPGVSLANKKVSGTRLDSNPFITMREVETELVSSLYKMKSIELNKTGDVRYGNGKCSPDLKLFENNLSIIKTLKKDLTNIMVKAVKSEIYVGESFFNILSTGSGTTAHRHLDPFDKAYKITDQKYSLVYYLSVGDQSCSDPGILKLFDPDEEILPTKGSIVITPASRKHSAVYNGKIDRIMIGVNFYSLI